jgi:hypothetical protein
LELALDDSFDVADFLGLVSPAAAFLASRAALDAETMVPVLVLYGGGEVVQERVPVPRTEKYDGAGQLDVGFPYRYA